jgi:hypothetical protein
MNIGINETVQLNGNVVMVAHHVEAVLRRIATNFISNNGDSLWRDPNWADRDMILAVRTEVFHLKLI